MYDSYENPTIVLVYIHFLFFLVYLALNLIPIDDTKLKIP